MAVVLSADGCVEADVIATTGCCPPPLCGNDLCCTFVAFFNLLPSGPLWDLWKARAIDYFQRSADPANCPLVQDPDCPSLVLHAIYAVLRLKQYTYEALWPALRESESVTACTTLDDWLRRLQWEDCYRQHCRSVLLGELTPYEVWSDCGPLFCETDFPPELEEAVKRGIVIALTRAQMGVIKTVCGLNWIIEPLGAEVRPIYSLPQPAHPIAPAPCDALGWCAEDVVFQVCATRDWIEGVGPCGPCDTHDSPPHVQAYWDRGCDRPAGLPGQIWPAVLAAECIVRSMLPASCFPPCGAITRPVPPGALINLTLSSSVITEGSPADTVIGTIVGNKQNSILTLVNSAGGRFAIVGDSLLAGFVATDYETATSHQIVIRETLTSIYNSPHDTTLTIAVADVTEIPVLIDLTLSNGSIPENAAPGTMVGTVLGAKAGSILSLTNTAGGRFVLSGTTLMAGATATDYETAVTHNVTIRETLSGAVGNPRDTVLTVTITNIAEIALAALTLSASTIAENSTAGTVVGTIQNRRAGSTLSLTDSASNRFALSGTNIVAGATTTDYETATSHSITVREIIADATNSPRDTVLTVTVTDVAEPPTRLLNDGTIRIINSAETRITSE